jgi:tetratricopeptide (TPR) repeat protein
MIYYSKLAHQLALSDLGRAIALNPMKSENYFLRGDCNSKLGNYEQVIILFFF